MNSAGLLNEKEELFYTRKKTSLLDDPGKFNTALLFPSNLI